MMTEIPPDRVEPVDPVDPAGTGAPPRTRNLVGTALVVVLVLAALAGAGWTGWQVRQERAADDDRTRALSVARQAAVAFTSYDAQHIDEDLDRVREMSTGDFRDQFTKALGALTGAIKKAHGVSEGEVTQMGLIRSSDSTAVVIAAVDATITNKETQKPSLRRYRLQITLTSVDDTWLISDISPVA